MATNDPFSEYFKEVGGHRVEKERDGTYQDSRSLYEKPRLVNLGLLIAGMILIMALLGGIFVMYKYPKEITKLKDELEKKSLAQVTCEKILDEGALARAQETFEKAILNTPPPLPGHKTTISTFMRVKLPSGRIEEFRHNVSNKENNGLH